jgi:hypothetical protein
LSDWKVFTASKRARICQRVACQEAACRWAA